MSSYETASMPRDPSDDELFSQEKASPFEYELLVGHPRTDGSFKTSEQLRMEYINLTDGLIHKMTHGVTEYNPETRSSETVKPDYVIFLDKSARPVAWLTNELWDTLAPEPGSTEIPKKPEFRFLNIDREQWVNHVDPSGEGMVDMSRVQDSVIRSLRSIFVEPKDKRDGLTEAIDTAPAALDDKQVLVVDEVISSGRTLKIAKAFLRKAFPTAKVAGTYWMSGTTMKAGAKGNADLPVWYHEKVEGGRGVGNRTDGTREISPNLTQQLGRWFLSTRFPEVDQAGLQLRREFHQLATNPDVPVIPSYERDDDYERAEAVNADGAEAAYEELRRIKGLK